MTNKASFWAKDIATDGGFIECAAAELGLSLLRRRLHTTCASAPETLPRHLARISSVCVAVLVARLIRIVFWLLVLSVWGDLLDRLFTHGCQCIIAIRRIFLSSDELSVHLSVNKWTKTT